MKLTFHGTLGSLERGNARHARQSVLELTRGHGRVLLDCGRDWREKLPALKPDAIVLTHAHPDHVDGLAEGAPCPVFADAATWQRIADFPLAQRRRIERRRPFSVCGLCFEAFRVRHSLRAPAVGLRIRAGRAGIFYCPDLAQLPERRAALRGVQLYIGDGSSFGKRLLRREYNIPCGHAPLPSQLAWCAREGVPRLLATHCGEEIIDDEAKVAKNLRALAARHGMEAAIAWDGMTLEVKP